MAANRVGVISALTTALTELGGDLQEVSQTVLQRFLTIILAAEFPEHRDPQIIVDHIRDVCRPFGVDVCLKDPEREQLQPVPTGGVQKYFLTLSGKDEPGVMRKVSSRLAQEEIDITDLYAARKEQDRTFVMVMELAVPECVDVFSLVSELEEMGQPFGLHPTMHHESDFISTDEPRAVRLLASREIR
jgi:glycine cleavage system transcriptional repressor